MVFHRTLNRSNPLFLLLLQNHYYGIKNLKGFIGPRYISGYCYTSYNKPHSQYCPGYCSVCYNPSCTSKPAVWERSALLGKYLTMRSPGCICHCLVIQTAVMWMMQKGSLFASRAMEKHSPNRYHGSLLIGVWPVLECLLIKLKGVWLLSVCVLNL